MNDKFETIQMLNEYIIKLINGIVKTVEYFQEGEDKKGCELISPIADGIQWMSDALLATKDLHKQDFKIENMNEKLNEIVNALENEDFILVGDLFQYELLPIIEDIQNKMVNVIAS